MRMITSTTTSLVLLLTFCWIGASSAADEEAELKVEVYDGPKECEFADKVKSGDYLMMHYTGTIHESSATGEKGLKFDSSRDRGKTFDFQVGVGQVIKGWDQGIVGLCKGAKANMIIPPDLGYGEQGARDAIPPGATLHFDVEVVDISDKPPPPPNVFAMIDVDGDGRLDKNNIEQWFLNNGNQPVPDELWEKEDTNKDGFISWEEFSGPKGDKPPQVAEESGDAAKEEEKTDPAKEEL